MDRYYTSDKEVTTFSIGQELQIYQDGVLLKDDNGNDTWKVVSIEGYIELESTSGQRIYIA
jgi:hypothetical protein